MRQLVPLRLRARILFLVVAAALALPASPGLAESVAMSSAGDHRNPALADQVLNQKAHALAFGVGSPSGPLRPQTGLACTPMVSAISSTNTANPRNELTSVAFLNPTDAWAVGFTRSSGSGPYHTLAEHFNGTTWTVVSTPNPGSGIDVLNAVSGSGPNDVWAVGQAFINHVSYNMALHWNGVKWTNVTVPEPGGSNGQFLSGVSAVSSNDVWASGSSFLLPAGAYQSTPIHWNGSSWSVVSAPSAGGGDNILNAVYATTSGDAWMVGSYLAAPATITPMQTLIEHWDGTSWSIVSSPNVSVSGDNVLINVSASSATEVWADGYSSLTPGTTPAQTLTMHLVTGTWTIASSPDIGTGDNVLFGIDSISPTNAWATGFGKPTPAAGGTALAAHWDGSSWTSESTDSPGPNGNSLNWVATLPGNDTLMVGDQFNASVETSLVEQFQLPAPTSVSAAPGDQSASVSWTAPAFDCGFSTTSYLVTASDGCVVLNTISTAASPVTFNGLTNGSPFFFTVQAVSTSLGAETPSAVSAATIPSGATPPTAASACSGRQYSLAHPSGSTFTDLDATNLALTLAPGADSMAVINLNADLWTATSGINQDIGIFVSGGVYGSGQVVGWKESGGSAGTFSPNAAMVQAVIPVAASTSYTFKAQWKANKTATSATIFAGAGPIEGDFRFTGSAGFSPTRLSVDLVPSASSPVTSAVSNQQYSLVGSDGVTFTDMDAANLNISVTPASDSTAVITGNVDLWTANAGFNQDVGINVDGTVVSWKESGGSAGTFSPNAAFVEAVVPLTVAGSPHHIKLQWKTNKPEGSAKIYAGAGPWPGGTSMYSPTRLTVLLQPAINVTDKSSTLQYPQPPNDGATWHVVDATNLEFTLSPGASFTTFELTANADLWTANSGINQDIGIFVSGGEFGAGTLVAWKESGGSAGTFSPNAAFLDGVVHLTSGSYTVWLAVKQNRPATGSIYIGAGPWPPHTSTFSPTWLTAVELSTP